MIIHSPATGLASSVNNIKIKLTLAMLQNISTFVAIYLLIPTFAFKQASNVDEYMEANQRIIKSNLDNGKIDDIDATKRFEQNTKPEELHALRNYILDNSIVKRTPITGNIYDLDEIEDVPCTCEQKGRDAKLLGEDYFPVAIETRICDVQLCPAPYGCKERLHNVTVLRRKRFMGEPSEEVLPADLNNRWIAVKEPVVVGCMCVKEY